jgi:hypothetical protein
MLQGTLGSTCREDHKGQKSETSWEELADRGCGTRATSSNSLLGGWGTRATRSSQLMGAGERANCNGLMWGRGNQSDQL